MAGARSSLLDEGGRPVDIPVPERINVLIFLRGDW
jgi:hypothetical protein